MVGTNQIWSCLLGRNGSISYDAIFSWAATRHESVSVQVRRVYMWKFTVTLLVLMTSLPAFAQFPLPADRGFPWNPGMTSVGGIPTNRSQCGATLSPSAGDNSAAIQAAVDACPAGQMVLLGPGTFVVNNFVLVNKGITLRGSGAGTTILSKTNGTFARTTTVVPGTIATGGPLNNRIYTPSDQSTIPDSQPIIVIGEARWPKPDSTTSQNLTVDGAQGSFSVTVANAVGFAAGQFVLF